MPGVRRKIVHLGNVGDDRAYRSKMLAQRFSNFDFHGIDLKGLRSKKFLHQDVEANTKLKEKRVIRLKQRTPENLNQIRADFIKGLSKFPDNSLDIITSDFAVGFYKKEKTYKKAKQNADAAKEISQQYINIGSEEYTQEIIELVYKKLKPKGKFIAYYFIQNNTGNLFFKRNLDIALRKSNFLYYNTEKVDISKIPEEYRTIYALHLGKESIYRVVAEKE
jgi:hypothetical protein